MHRDKFLVIVHVEFHSKIKNFEKLVHLVGSVIRKEIFEGNLLNSASLNKRLSLSGLSQKLSM
jgi:hypothetical protein